MQWRRDLWLAVLAIGVGVFVAGERILAATDHPGLVAPVLLVGVGTAPAAFYAACLGHDLRCTLPTWIVVAAAAAAGLLGAGVAGLLGYPALASLGPVSTVAVAIVEESTILLVPLALLFTLPTRRAADGLLVGAAAGAGFAVAEAVSYLFGSVVDAGGTIGPASHDVLLRGLLGPTTHLAWSGIATAALWLAAHQHWNGRALRRFVLAVTGVVVLHAFGESAGSVLADVALAAVSVALLGWVVHRTAAPRRAVPTRVLARPAASSAADPRPDQSARPEQSARPSQAAAPAPPTVSPVEPTKASADGPSASGASTSVATLGAPDHRD